MTPGEVMIQQQLAYEALSQSVRAPPTAESPAAQDRGTAESSKVTTGTKSASKRKMSIREMVRLECNTV